MNLNPDTYKFLLDDIPVDTSGHWSGWDWKAVSPWNSYDFARLEEYRDSIVVAYRLYNRIGLEHCRRILEGASREAKILDEGGGTGRKAIPLALDGFTRITLLDIAPEWLRLAQEKARRDRVEDRLSFIEGDILDLSCLQEENFDFVFAMGGVASYCGDTGKALKEIFRVLKPGGRFLCDGIHNRTAALHMSILKGQLEEAERLARNIKNNSGINTNDVSPEELDRLAHGAGFDNIGIYSEFAFVPDDSIMIGPDTERWERLTLELEMKYYKDPRFLGTGMLMVEGTKQSLF